MPKRSRRARIAMPSKAEDQEINLAARSDPDALPLTPRQLQAMVPMRALRGRPPLANRKQLVSIRYSPEVLLFFRATGAGWQSRIDAVLREYVARRTRRAAGGA